MLTMWEADMLKNQLITPEGTKDYLFEEAAARREVEARLRALFESRGFCEVVTPGIEFLDVFSVRGHGIPVETMVKLSDHKGRLMALRPDSTLPIARLCATRLRGEGLPLRLYYNQPVYSETRTLSGRSDEIMQAGVELIGEPSLRADLEMVTMAVQALECCPDFRLELGHIGIFNALADSLGLGEEDREQLRLLIEAKNYPALGDLLDRWGGEAAVLKQLPRLFGGEEVFDRAAKLLGDGAASDVLGYLRSIYQNVQKLGLGDRVSVDLGIVNRTDYYTGIVFKGYMEGHGVEVLSGGRYDTLLDEFGGSAGAIGFAVNLDALSRAVLAQEKAPFIRPAQILVHATDGFEMEGIARLTELSAGGVSAEFSGFSTVEEAVGYARRKGIPRVVFVTAEGESEVEVE